MTRFFRYVPHSRAKAYEALGWIDKGPSPGSHGEYSRVMVWERDQTPREPEKQKEPVS